MTTALWFSPGVVGAGSLDRGQVLSGAVRIVVGDPIGPGGVRVFT